MNAAQTLTTVAACLWLLGAASTQASSSTDPIAKSCIDQQLRNHQQLKNKSLEAGDFNTYCTCVARVVRNLASDQQLSQLNSLVNQPKPEWLKGIERNAQKQCMVDPNAKLQST